MLSDPYCFQTDGNIAHTLSIATESSDDKVHAMAFLTEVFQIVAIGLGTGLILIIGYAVLLNAAVYLFDVIKLLQSPKK